jgi:hypothetical protein
LNGWTTASIFFITPLESLTLCFEEIAFLTVLAQVETLLLGIVLNANANQNVADLEDNERPHDRESNRDQNADRLVEDLPGITIHQTERDDLTVNLRVVDKMASNPISSAGIGCTKPDAGVIATSPATAPEIPPSMLGFPDFIHSATIQPNAAVAPAKCLLMNALVASPLAAVALPALNPNQPTQRRHAPITLTVRLCGFIASFRYPSRLPGPQNRESGLFLPDRGSGNRLSPRREVVKRRIALNFMRSA